MGGGVGAGGGFAVDGLAWLAAPAFAAAAGPALRPAADAVTRRATRLLADRDQISFGVAQQQLIIDGIATDPNHPVLQRLASTLHRHQLAALSITRGVEPGELAEALRTLGAEPERTVTSGTTPSQLPSWPHVKLHPLTFDRLTLLSDAPSTGGQPTHVGPYLRNS